MTWLVYQLTYGAQTRPLGQVTAVAEELASLDCPPWQSWQLPFCSSVFDNYLKLAII